MNSKIFIFQSKPTIIIWIHNYNCDWESVQINILLDCLAELFATIHWAHDVVVTLNQRRNYVVCPMGTLHSFEAGICITICKRKGRQIFIYILK